MSIDGNIDQYDAEMRCSIEPRETKYVKSITTNIGWILNSIRYCQKLLCRRKESATDVFNNASKKLLKKQQKWIVI